MSRLRNTAGNGAHFFVCKPNSFYSIVAHFFKAAVDLRLKCTFLLPRAASLRTQLALGEDTETPLTWLNEVSLVGLLTNQRAIGGCCLIRSIDGTTDQSRFRWD